MSSKLVCPVLLLALVATPSIALQDKLVIKNIHRGEKVVVMMNARNTPMGCLADSNGNEWVLRSPNSTGSIVLGNMAEGCVLDIAIFSESHAALFDSVAKKWTDKPGKVHKVTLQPRIKVPIKVWIAYEYAEEKAHKNVKLAASLYKKNKVGIELVPKFESVWKNNPGAVTIINDGIDATGADYKCTNIKAIQDRPEIYTANTLNVYYVDKKMAGRNCALKKTPPSADCTCTMVEQGDANITYIGNFDAAGSSMVAHELGHAFGLRPGPCWGHTFDDQGKILPGFGKDNIMTILLDAYTFSLGQVFRMNTYTNTDPNDKCGGTALINNGLRPGPGRECTPQANNNMCPALDMKYP